MFFLVIQKELGQVHFLFYKVKFKLILEMSSFQLKKAKRW